MEDNKEKNLEDIFEASKEYVNTRMEFVRLSLVEKGAKIIADLISNATVVVCFVLAFLFASVTLALFLAEELNSYAKGFGAVAGIYLLLALIVLFTKEKYIEKLLVNLFIRKYFDKVADKEDEK